WKTDLIVNADDFGRSREINAAVVRAHREGVLTSASLMVTGEAAAEAVALAREMPSLAVGLHLVLAAGRAALPPAKIPHLVDGEGNFPVDPAAAGLALFLKPAARGELAHEIAAQLDLFAATGLPLSHVDGHCHLHVHPTVFDLLLPQVLRHGARGFRLPRDPLVPALRWSARRPLAKVSWAAAFGLLSRRCRRRLAGLPLRVPERCHGLMRSGDMGEAYVLDLLARMGKRPAGSAEIYFHPTSGARVEALGPNPDDLAALLSPRVRQAIENGGLRLTTYAGLAGGSV
ncbi:MAG TPA: hopanoid biosynthesis-associated protein HpnK, partial [Thermoanaerobaculia bacterium]|nr:hopanoid biosynthesis-associated protein HpnK [Thermoanaerobaculia bacterium]